MTDNIERILRDRGPARRKPYAQRVNDLIARQGWAPACKHGHLDCSLVEGGHCSDEMELRGGRTP